MEVGKQTGCAILLSQNHLIITPMHQAGENGPSISKANDMIEDALVGLLGSQESKCKLLYDLTESYSEVYSVGGVIQLRNPLNSCERVWASIVDLPVFINKDGEQKYLLPPFISKESENELHMLKCTVKICTDSFDIKLQHCHPYAMIMGRQKKNVGIAIQFIKRAIKNFQK